MKKKSLIFILIACLGWSLTSCQDMLTPSSERHRYEIAQDTLYSYWGILRSLQNVAERYVVLGEFRGDLVDRTSYLSDSIRTILDFDMQAATDGSNRFLRAVDYYHVVNSCNAYLASYDSLRTVGTLEPYMKKEAAQVSAIRAWTYLQMVLAYGKVPFYTKPLLTTDEIASYKSHSQTATIDNLADLLVEDLEQAARVEAQYGFPQYDTYDNGVYDVHSSKLMFPVKIVLGDLFLAKGDKASCARAAQYYYDYLSGNQGLSIIPAGGAVPEGYDYYGFRPEGVTTTLYLPNVSSLYHTPWTETSRTSRVREGITAIASSANKLWGNVLRGVNEIYGYTSEIQMNTEGNDTSATSNAYIILTPRYDHKQIVASQAYLDLCDAQDYEFYIGAGDDQTQWVLTTDPNVGDARRYWLSEVYQTYSDGTSAPERFITKQNPYGDFTAVFPMIYRKSHVWLRFAEAICNAGYPGYAFAILKDGLCNVTDWLPEANAQDFEGVYRYSYVTQTGETVTSDESRQALAEQLIADVQFVDDAARQDSLTKLLAKIDSSVVSLRNTPNPLSTKMINYIALDEIENRPSYLNFNFTSFQGDKSINRVVVRASMESTRSSFISDDSQEMKDFTNGIHSRGCGYVRFSDREKSAFNYVAMVSKKAKENYGKTLTKEDIYDPANKELVQKCVEDLIVDEGALELAFEGNRFFDLMRVAHRRGDPAYLADKIAQRNPALRSRLMNESNWYFPLPNN